MRCNAAVMGRARTLALCVLASTAAHAESLQVGAHRFDVEIATTPAQRAHGLMGRTHLAADAGMLFVFEQAGRPCFWMRDTPLPLSIAFIAPDGRIAEVADMAPRSERQHCPSTDIRYALEVRQGEFQRRGIRPGAQISGLAR